MTDYTHIPIGKLIERIETLENEKMQGDVLLAELDKLTRWDLDWESIIEKSDGEFLLLEDVKNLLVSKTA